jgi:RNase P protein component
MQANDEKDESPSKLTQRAILNCYQPGMAKQYTARGVTLKKKKGTSAFARNGVKRMSMTSGLLKEFDAFS